MTFSDLERVYESVAIALDAIPQDKREVYLAKLVLVLAEQSADPAHVLQAIQACREDL